jgi:Holliday junction resolvasome RuvABC endonuclease subunit
LQTILTLDLSMSSTGWCVGNLVKFNIIDYGKLTTQKKDFENEDDRIIYICNYIEDIIKKYNIELVIIEDQYTARNSKTILLLRKALGAVMKTIKNNGCDIRYLYPTTVRKYLNIKQRWIKRIDKDGKETKEKIKIGKEEVAIHIQRNYIDIGEFSDKVNKKKTSDIYDAIALYIAYLNMRGE